MLPFFFSAWNKNLSAMTIKNITDRVATYFFYNWLKDNVVETYPFTNTTPRNIQTLSVQNANESPKPFNIIKGVICIWFIFSIT